MAPSPQLIIISEKAKGTVFALNEETTEIGRDSTNEIVLRDSSVSRKHCLIQKRAEDFELQDLGSYNGCFVNGQSVTAVTLQHGDQIRIGGYIFFFLLNAEDIDVLFEQERIFIAEEVDFNPDTTLRLKRGEAVYLNPENLAHSFPKMMRTGRDLSTLLKISNVLASIDKTEEVVNELFRLISESIPAERASILLFGKDTEDFVSTHSWVRSSDDTNEFILSRTVIDLCLKTSDSILSNDLSVDDTLSKSKSLRLANVHSVLCVPLIIFDEVIGVLYLDSLSNANMFDKAHLQLLTGIAEISAIRLQNVQRTEYLKTINRLLQDDLKLQHQIIGESEKINDVLRMVSRVAPTDSSVLIQGETGTGKELVARAIHQNSNRKDAPFIAINCATLTESLLESDLFGHERGAFTGAVGQKKGHFELANGGTVFLDEIGELMPTVQARLLRVLQEREIMRVGGTRSIKIDVRLIAATNRDIEKEIEEGRFRDDLFYRINVITITLPPLAERVEDIPLLSQFFLEGFNKSCNRNIGGFSASAMNYLKGHNWKGNVRELQNTIERAVILASSDTISHADLAEGAGKLSKNDLIAELTYQEAVHKAKRMIIENALSDSEGNVSQAAEKLGMLPNNLHRLIKNLEVGK
ncbi:MAG: sigma 54-interacting transcriptional regulator [Pyrinomonadaceae bacterium]